MERVIQALKRDVVTTRLLFDPLAVPLVRLLLRFDRIQPNHLTLVGFLIGMGASVFFCAGTLCGRSGSLLCFFI